MNEEKVNNEVEEVKNQDNIEEVVDNTEENKKDKSKKKKEKSYDELTISEKIKREAEKEDFVNHIGKVVSRYVERDIQGRSCRQLSTAMGFSPTYLNRVVNANVTANSYLLWKIMKFFKIPPHELFLSNFKQTTEQEKQQEYMEIMNKAIREDVSPDHLNSLIDMAINLKK